MNNLINNKFKTVSPYETIANIYQLLLKENLLTKIQWFNQENNIFSCTFSLFDYPRVSSNGKGTSAAYAQASAMAEFLERLQSFFLLSPNNKENIYYSDDNEKQERKFICLNDLSVKYISIPNMPKGSSGLAGGNTYLEAISQGLCELFERYCVTQFFKNNLYYTRELPLPEEYLWILKKIPGVIQLYDISLNTNIPCVLLLYFLKDQKDICGISFGCAQTYDLAIERTITEFFQGTDITGVNKQLKEKKFSLLVEMENIETNIFDIYTHGFGIISKNHLRNFIQKKKLNIEKQSKNFITHEDFIQTFIKELYPIFGNIYVKFVGFLGFPTVMLYCDNYNEIDCFYKNENWILNGNIISLSYYIECFLNNLNQKTYDLTVDKLSTMLYEKDKKEKNVNDNLEILNKLLELNKNFIPDYSCLNFLINNIK